MVIYEKNLHEFCELPFLCARVHEPFAKKSLNFHKYKRLLCVSDKAHYHFCWTCMVQFTILILCKSAS